MEEISSKVCPQETRRHSLEKTVKPPQETHFFSNILKHLFSILKYTPHIRPPFRSINAKSQTINHSTDTSKRVQLERKTQLSKITNYAFFYIRPYLFAVEAQC